MNRGISEEALKLSDMHCSIPMKGMVDSFNVSVASGILMHHAVCDRTKRLVRILCLTHLILEKLKLDFSTFNIFSRWCLNWRYGTDPGYRNLKLL